MGYNDSGIIGLACTRSVPETVERLETLLQSKGIKIFARIDHAAEARTVGLTLRPTVLLIFGNPKLGTPLMNQQPSLALDLPTKALIWESAEGQVRLSYNSPNFCSSAIVWMHRRWARLSNCFRPPRSKVVIPFRGVSLIETT